MKLSPLVIHGGLHIPRWTDLFSDRLDVVRLDVVAGGNTTIVCTEEHDLPVGSQLAISITDAEVPNAIVAASVDDDGNIVVVTEHPHDLTFTPNIAIFEPWDEFVKVTGFDNPLINGTRQIVAIPDRETIIFAPGGDVTSIALTGNEVFLDRIDGEVIGWHCATVADEETLTFRTPSTVERSYTIESPTVVTNIRIAVAIHPDAALAQLTIEGDNATIDKGYIFILPHDVKTARSNPTSAFGPATEYRLRITDGFTVLVFLPSAGNAAHAVAIDKAQGEIFKAVLRTFHGLKVPRSELACGNIFVATFDGHQGASVSNRAIYAHEYRFDAPAQLTNQDAISPWEWASIDDAALENATPDSIGTVGTVPFRDLDVVGILHYGHPSPLTGTVTTMDENP